MVLKIKGLYVFNKALFKRRGKYFSNFLIPTFTALIKLDKIGSFMF
jgi:hypothetical protein